ncbi:hypothetical protein D3C85_850180 [compost metagenome]
MQPPLVDHHGLIGVLQRHVQIMQDDQTDQAVVPGFLFQKPHDVELVIQVQRRQGLVQQQHAGMADQRLRQAHQLLLSAGQRVQVMQRQMRDAQPFQQPVDGLQIHGTRHAVAGPGRHQHRLEHPQMHGRRQALGQVHHMAGAFAVIQAGQVQAVERCPAGARADQAGHGLEQGRFAAAVRPQQRRDFARRQCGYRQAVQDVLAPVSGREALHGQFGLAQRVGGGRHGSCLRSTTDTKKGMPTKAVTMPTGTTTPGTRFLDAMEASDRITAPTSALPGR